MKRVIATTETVVTKVAEEALDSVSGALSVAEKGIEHHIAPVRKSVLRRFPTLFLLSVTFGVTAVGTGIQGFLLKYNLLETHPEIIVVIGLVVLILTGTVYKKLG